MRSEFANSIQIAVSANNRETAINVEQTLDTGMLCDLASIPTIEPRRENNSDEAHGKEEPDLLYNLGGVSKMKMTFPRCQAQHMSFLGSYGLGAIAAPAAAGTGYRQTITPISGDLDNARSNPSFTLAARLGERLEKRLFASMFVDGFVLSMERDAWVKLEADLNGTGKNSSNLLEDSITAAWNATSLTLTKAAAGSDAPTRLDNVHSIIAEDPATPGKWVDVVFSAVSGATPGVVTITAPGGTADSTTYKVLYNQAETGDYAWCSFPNRVEDPLRVSDFAVNIGGLWNGTALVGGHSMAADINSLKWNYKNNLTPDFTSGAATYAYANRGLRKGRVQTVSMERRFMDFIIGQKFHNLEYFTLYAKAEGEEYDTGHKYTIETVFPRVSIKGRPVQRADNRLVEAVEFEVLEDETYGSVILYTKNEVQYYAKAA